MAKKLVKPAFFDFSSWNFIIFLVLTCILIVVVATILQGPVRDLSAKAGIQCPQITSLPRPEDCPGGKWVFSRDPVNSCSTFTCPTK